MISVVRRRFANPGWRISKSEGEYRNLWHERGDTLLHPQKIFCVCRRHDRDPIYCLFSVGRPVFELCGRKIEKRHCKHLCLFDLAVAKSNLGRENSAIRLRASNNSSVPGE